MSIETLLNVPSKDRNAQWLACSLQEAAQLEWATIPPYLCAYWSIRTEGAPDNTAAIRDTIRQIVIQEMLHLGLVCNMIAGIGATPNIYSENFAPRYPGVLPGHVHPGLTIGLAGLSKDQVSKFMQIELPEDPLARKAKEFPTIGSFYDAIAMAFDQVNLKWTTKRQLTNGQMPELQQIHNVGEAKAKIDLIKRQGEGTATSPFVDNKKTRIAPAHELAHYYRFGEIFHEHHLRPDAAAPRGWSFTGNPPIPFPRPQDLYLMAEVPKGGYAESEPFDRVYMNVLNLLHTAWAQGDSNILSNGIGLMDNDLSDAAIALLQRGIAATSGVGIKGPDFRFLPT